MTIYHFNLLVGFEPNGVDKAQGYRAKLLDSLGMKSKFIFTRLPDRNLINYYRGLGIQEESMLIAHLALTTIKTSCPSLTLNAVLNSLGFESVEEPETDIYVQPITGDSSLVCYLEAGYVHQVDYISSGMLLKRDVYSYTKMYTEHYKVVATEGGLEAQVIKRSFWNEDGGLAFEEYLQQGRSSYKFGYELLHTHQELVEKFIKSLTFTSDDIILMDRTSNFEFAQVLLTQLPHIRKGVVLHSEHEFDHHAINYEYYYSFKYAKEFDFFITATDQQKQRLEKTFQREFGFTPRVLTIPVGYIEELNYPKEARKPYSIIVASRLIPSKRIDLAIKAVAKVLQKLPDITLDIYGDGMLFQELSLLIKELGLEEYVHLKGWQDVSQQYQHYELYLATSFSETFGLSLMEAIGSGVGMIGFDFRYGNPTFIKNGENGKLLSYVEDERELVERLSENLYELLQENMETIHEASYRLAEGFTKEKVGQAWLSLLSQGEK